MARNESFFQRLIESHTLVPLVRKVHMGESGIYLIHNVIADRFYVGSADNLYTRKNVHLTQLRKNKHHNIFLQRDFNKTNGKIDFFVLKLTKRSLLVFEEQKILDKVFGKPDCYNLNPVANSWLGRSHSKKTKKLLSVVALKRKISHETRKKMSESKKGIPLADNHPIRNGHSEKTKEKIRNSTIGEKNHFFGKTQSEETKKKISESLKGRYFGHKNKVKATNILSGEVLYFESMAEAARDLELNQGHISSVCSDKLQQTGRWKFIKVVNNGSE